MSEKKIIGSCYSIEVILDDGDIKLCRNLDDNEIAVISPEDAAALAPLLLEAAAESTKITLDAMKEAADDINKISFKKSVKMDVNRFVKVLDEG